jgi:hypothetical protein
VGLRTYVWCVRSKVCASVAARRANPSHKAGSQSLKKGLLSVWEVAEGGSKMSVVAGLGKAAVAGVLRGRGPPGEGLSRKRSRRRWWS